MAPMTPERNAPPPSSPSSRRTRYLVASAVGAGLLVGVIAARATPGTPGGATKTSLSFAGSLTDASGVALTGPHTLAFTFHNGANTCSPSVSGVTAAAPSGAFEIEVPLDTCPTFFDGNDVTVDILVDGTNQVVTGQPVDPVAYAHYADKAAQAGRATQADTPSVGACPSGQVLTGGATGFTCITPPPPTYPTCTAGQVLTNTTGALTCVTPPTGSSAAKFVGETTTTTNGRIVHTGADPGLASAAAFCADQYGAGAHMCTEVELYDSVATGVISSSTGTLARAWTYFPNWQATAGTLTTEPTAGLGDNCSSYTYGTADTHTTGTAFAWETWSYNSNWTLKFYGGPTDGPCYSVHPIACCK
jgi:hypothetical protein